MISTRSLPSPRDAALIVLMAAAIGAIVNYEPMAGVLVPAGLIGFLVLMKIERPVLAIFFFLLIIQDPLLFLVGGDQTPVGYLVKRSDETLLIVVAGWTILRSVDAQRALRTRGVGILIAMCVSGMILSSLSGRVALWPALMDLLLFSKPFLLFTIGTSVTVSDHDITKSLRVILPCMMGVVLFALIFLLFPALQIAYLGSLRVPDERLGFVSAQGFFDGPGPYSWFCAATFAVFYAAYLAFSRSAYLYGSLIAAVFTILSWRRKSMGGILAMVLVTVLLHARTNPIARRRALAILAAVVFVGATALAPFLGDLWHNTVQEYGGDADSTARNALYSTSVAIAIDHFPLGTGLASFASYASQVYYSDVYRDYGLTTVWGLSPEYNAFITDTFWPMVLGEGGVVAFVPYLVFVVLLVRTCWIAARRKDLTPAGRFLPLWALLLLVGSLFESTASHIYDSTMQSALVMVPVGVAWQRFAVQGVGVESGAGTAPSRPPGDYNRSVYQSG
jgi:hypothetical protein